MFSLDPPDDNRYDMRDDLEPEWPGELPDYVEEWNELWWRATCSPLSMGIGQWFCAAMVEEHQKAA